MALPLPNHPSHLLHLPLCHLALLSLSPPTTTTTTPLSMLRPRSSTTKTIVLGLGFYSVPLSALPRLKFPPIRSGFGILKGLDFLRFVVSHCFCFCLPFSILKLLFLCIQDSVFDSGSSCTVVLSCMMVFLTVLIFLYIGNAFLGFWFTYPEVRKKVVL